MKRARNERMIAMRESLGFRSAHACAVALGLEYVSYVAFERGDGSPLGADGVWRELALWTAEQMGTTPERLWPAEGRRVRCEVRAAERAFTMTLAAARDEAVTLCRPRGGKETPDTPAPARAPGQALIERREDERRMWAAFDGLPERAKGILLSYFDDENFADIGRAVGLSRTRIQQVVVGSLERLRKDVRLKNEDTRTTPGAKKRAPTPKLAVCRFCKKSDRLISEESPVGGRVYICMCSPSLGEARRQKLVGKVREGALPVEDLPAAVRETYGAPPAPPARAHATEAWSPPEWGPRGTRSPLRQFLSGLSSEEILRDYRERDLLHQYGATHAELMLWVETGELPFRCQAAMALGLEPSL